MNYARFIRCLSHVLKMHIISEILRVKLKNDEISTFFSFFLLMAILFHNPQGKREIKHFKVLIQVVYWNLILDFPDFFDILKIS